MTTTLQLIHDMYDVLELHKGEGINFELLEKEIHKAEDEIKEAIQLKLDYDKLWCEYKEHIHISEYMKINGGK